MILILSFMLSLQVPPDRILAPDKIKHFLLAAFVQSVSYSALRLADAEHSHALAGATGVTALAAVGKEVHDWRSGGVFSPRDLLWDAAGASGATVVLSRTVR